MEYPIQDIANVLGVENLNNPELHISELLTDSRVMCLPTKSLFFALVTPNNNGHKFVQELYDRGVRNFVVNKISPEWIAWTDANFLPVDNTLIALQRIAALHRKKFEIPVIGITGSNGKTIVKEWLYQILHDQFNITYSPRSYNSQIGVPLSVWKMTENTTLGIFEAGISQVGEMSRLEDIIHPTIGIFTNIGQAHQEGFESLKEKCLEKLDLFINCDAIICEEENELIEECMEIACLSHKRFTWSRKGSNNSPIHILKIERLHRDTVIHYTVLGMESLLQIPFTDAASIENAIHVLAASVCLRTDITKVNLKMRFLEPIAMRLDVRTGKNNCFIINDSYNSDINSLTIALDFLYQRATNGSLKRVVIMSDILQSGIPTKDLYTLTADLLQSKKIDILIGIGKDISENKKLFKNIESHFYLTTDDFITSNLYKSFSGMCILLKGARDFSFEKINKLLEVKTHETVLTVDLDAIIHNYNFYRSKLKPETKIVCMVKADGYGSGASEVAKTLQYHKADYLAVAVADEGIILRNDGIKLPIIVLNSEVGGFDDLSTNHLEPEVYNFRILEAFIKEAKTRGLHHYPIHLKIDTGMHRLGFTEEDLTALTDLLNRQSNLKVVSAFSHLAASESWNFDDFTAEQIATFKRIAQKIENQLGYPIMKHILNSAGIERFPEYQLDMVRLGISLYGVSASGLNGLRNVHNLKTTILQIKHVKAGETVGYGRKGIIEKDTTIATIRIGYADGLDRRLGNRVGAVIVNGQEAPYVGNICMDLSMIDVTGLEVKEGDPVIVFGDGMTALELANRIGTIPYEILTSVSSRVKSIYYKE